MNPDSHEPRFSRSEREAETEEPQTSQVIRKYWKCKSGGHPKLKPECAGFLIDLIWIISRTRPSTVTIAFVVVQLLNCVWLFATLWTAACQAPLSITNSQSLLKLMSIHRVSEATQPSHPLHPLRLLPSIFASIRECFSSESTLHIRWPKYWSLSFRFSPSNEYLGLISFRIDWFDLLTVQDSQVSFPKPLLKSINSLVLSFLYGPTLTSIHDYW